MHLSNRIAIVGLGGIFPGAPTLERFWTHVRGGVDAAREVPAGRWLLPPDEAYHPGVGTPDHVYSKRGYFLDPFRLDPDGLQLDPAVLTELDPLYHLALHAGRQAWRDGSTRALNPGRVGVILGNLALPTDASSALAREVLLRTFEEQITGQSAPPAQPTHTLNRFVTGLPAELVGQSLGLGGTCHTLDAACASSLYAVKLAVDELLAGQADAMLAGGVSRPDCLYTQMGFSQLHALSPSGRCAPFDAAADGLVVGEGCGVLLLKRLADAVRDGDRIHAVIAGIGLSNDVQGKLLAPSSEGQLRAMRAAYQQAGWAPQDVGLIECHATGTPVGDATEFASLRTLWGNSGWRAGQCVIGSVKSNIGHTLTAAGSAALLKALFALRAQTLPPTANFARPAPVMDYEASPFRVLAEARPWADNGRPRRAGVSAFGFGGINAHILLEEWRPTTTSVTVPANVPARPAVAIVGMEARFGPWQSLRAYQERMLGGRPHDAPSPPTRWWGVNDSAWGRAELAGMAERRGWFIDELALPADKFRIPPRELEELLPQQLLMLQVAAGAIADAKWNADQLLRTGVFLGIELDLNTTNYQLRWALPERARAWAQQLGVEMTPAEFAAWLAALREATGPALNANRTMGGLASVAASRIAREFHIGGPSFTLSSEETSGLHALHVAVQMLQNGELDQALVGAVDFAGEARSVLASMKEAPTDGAAALVLKRHADALRDGDRIYAVIRDVAATRPAGGVSPPRESEGSGTLAPLGGLTPPAGLAAGAATGLAEVVTHALALHQEMLPGRYWLRDRAAGPRRATVSTSSVGGQRVQVTLEEHPTSAPRLQPLGPRAESLFAIEADDPAALLDGLRALRQHAVTAAGGIEALARQWWQQHGSQPRKRRCVALLARDARELEGLIDTASQALRHQPQRALTGGERIVYAPEPLGPTEQLAFVFPGSGNHFPGMGRALAAQWPELLRRQDAENTHLRSQYLPELFWDCDAIPPTATHRDLIFGQVTLGILVAELLQSLGVRPDAVIGYSLGETVSLFATRAWTQRDEMLRRMTASSLFTHDLGGECRAARAAWQLADGEAVDWTAGVVACPAEAVRQALPGRARVYLLIVNTPRECVIGGQRAAVEALVRDLRCPFLPLAGVSTVHCEVARSVEAAYRELHLFPTTPMPRVRYYSGALAQAHELTRERAADSITAQAIAGSDFRALIEQAYADGIRTFVEIGPGVSCSRMIAAILEGKPHFARSACVAGQDAVGTVLRVLAHLLAERVPVNLGALYGQEAVPAEPARGGRALVVPVGGSPFRAPPRPGRVRSEPEYVPTIEPEVIPEMPVPEVVVVDEPIASAPDGPVQQLVATQAANADAHSAFLAFADRLNQVYASQLSWQMTLFRESPTEIPAPLSPKGRGEPEALARSRAVSGVRSRVRRCGAGAGVRGGGFVPDEGAFAG